MKAIIPALIAAAGLASAAPALAQNAPAKDNAPVKATHTVDDGGATTGANSFTEAQARGHIANSGFTAVSALHKGHDGVWRGTAHKGHHAMKVALDFKGNVTSHVIR